MSKSWIRVDVVVPEPDAEELAFDAAEILGVGVEMTSEGFRYYLDPAVPAPDREAGMAALLAAYRDRSPDKSAPLVIHTEEVPDDDWADRWKAFFKPMRVGRRFLICPTWEVCEPAVDDRRIIMDPGRAFGTGHHETTRLCLEWLEDRAEALHPEAASLLDLGTGSGILAFGAALLGFDRIVGLDIDVEAVEVAKENRVLNGLDDRIVLAVGSLADLDERFHVVVANIQANPLMALAEPLASHIQPGGIVALSGILTGQEQAVRRAYEAAGFILADRRSDGEWCLLEFQSGG
jgi:ribosomal protein L11 methyltransferase